MSSSACRSAIFFSPSSTHVEFFGSEVLQLATDSTIPLGGSAGLVTETEEHVGVQIVDAVALCLVLIGGFLLVTFIKMCGNLETLHVQKALDGMGKFLQLFALSSTQISIATHHIQANFIELLLQNSQLIAIFLMSILLSSVVICIFNILFDISEMKLNAKHSRK